jgi:thiol-disulfide isomerase/thioredoxin
MARRFFVLTLSLFVIASWAAAETPPETKKSPRPRRLNQSPLDEKLSGPSTDAAIEALDAAIQEKPEDKSLPSKRWKIVSRLVHEKRYQDALPQAEKAFEFEMSYEGDWHSANNLFNAATVLAMTLDGLDQPQQALEGLEKARKVLTVRFKIASDDNGRRSYGQAKIHVQQAIASRLVKLGQENAALQLMADEEEIWKKKFVEENGKRPSLSLWRVAMLARIRIAEESKRADEVRALTEVLDRETLATLERAPTDSTNLIEFLEVRFATLDRTFRDDPEGARALLEATRPVVEKYKNKDPENGRVAESWVQRLETYGPRIENASNAKRLMGQPAPPFEIAAWVNGSPRPLDSLRGKVVILDFWAIWCAPCIASFPDLKMLHKDFQSEGLEIVAVTRPYNFFWDKESDSPMGAEDPVEIELEADAVERFMKKHELPFSGIVAPKPDHMFSDYGVAGIPHVVVIDRKGIVRMMKVGHDKEAVAAIRKLIQQLLTEE